ncbi:vWA domain-containing protein [Mesorhizobium sp. NBSH29]|uniref:vWA domain-containing protein n=1 Tax=Mesorhizobium sp. NBSH29 TaxID=2654249 RepID=UPI001896452A|nr:VWA-like domain-containing protein [Mesorhizobium sp. NBSH29]
MNTPVENKILAARTSLMWDHPFFGSLAVQLQVVDATEDPAINTMATDGKHLFYDENFVMGLTKDELLFVSAHEVIHNASEHHLRRQHRKPGRWNKAADYVINGDLIECKVGTMPKGGLFEPRFVGLSAEEVYRILDDENDGDDSDEGQGGDPGGCGEVIDGAPMGDKAAIADAQADMQSKVRQAAAIAKGMNAGSLPAGIKRIVDKLLRPKVDWREVLRRFVDESLTKDSSWAKPNRRFLASGLVLPGMVSIGLSHFVIAVDTSGSIDQKALAQFASEIRAAFEESMIDKMTVIYADTDVHHVQEFTAGDIVTLEAKGGGGTAFSNTFEWIAKNASDATVIAYFTDLYVGDFGKEPAAPVIWAVQGDSATFDQLTENTPFGEAILLEVA